MVNIIQTCRYFGTLLSNRGLIKSNIRGFHKGIQGSDSGAYQGDGRTTVRMVQDGEPNVNFVDTYSAEGFRLSNNLYISGSILLFPTHVFSWNVKKGGDITPESLRIFDLLVPKVKIVVIGYGRLGDPYDASIPLKLKSKGISCEMLPTQHAITTYNYLVADAVHVAGAFVPVRGQVIQTERDNAAMTSETEFLKQDYDYEVPDRTRESLEEIRMHERLQHQTKGKKKFDP